jgi:hypothetical protein
MTAWSVTQTPFPNERRPPHTLATANVQNNLMVLCVLIALLSVIAAVAVLCTPMASMT